MSRPVTSKTDVVEAVGNRQQKRTRMPVWMKRLLLLSISTLIACLLAEAVVILVLGPQVRFPRHVVEAPWGLRYNLPGATYAHRSADGVWEFRINNQGMRADRDYDYTKAPDVKRIVSLGDSFTIGYECNVEDSFSTILEKRLGASGYQVEVLNAGVSGFSNAEECLYLERELIKYEPDVVLISFFVNDFGDNLRSGLFRLDDRGELRPWKHGYVPVGKLANFLNRSAIFGFLSARSNAFACAKEKLTLLIKGGMERRAEGVPANEDGNSADLRAPSEPGTVTYHELLTARVFERIYGFLHQRKIPLIIQSIPMQYGGPRGKLVDAFPLDFFNVSRPGLYYVAAKEVLHPHVADELLYWQRSHFHWTPFSHLLAGRAVAELIDDQDLLQTE